MNNCFDKFHMTLFKPVSAVFFDLDGTLVTSSLNFAAIRAELGYQQPVDFLSLMEQLPAPEAKRIAEIIEQHERDDASKSQAIDGAAELLDFCRHQNWPTVVVTRNSHQIAAEKLARAQLQVDRLIARDDAPAKPDPTIFHQLFDQYQLQADQVVYLGDYIYDIETARNAGMISALLCQHERPEYSSQADLCVASLEALQHSLMTHNQSLKA